MNVGVGEWVQTLTLRLLKPFYMHVAVLQGVVHYLQQCVDFELVLRGQCFVIFK